MAPSLVLGSQGTLNTSGFSGNPQKFWVLGRGGHNFVHRQSPHGRTKQGRWKKPGAGERDSRILHNDGRCPDFLWVDGDVFDVTVEAGIPQQSTVKPCLCHTHHTTLTGLSSFQQRLFVVVTKHTRRKVGLRAQATFPCQLRKMLKSEGEGGVGSQRQRGERERKRERERENE